MAVTQQAAPQAEFEAVDRHLRKPMGFGHLMFLPMGAIVGSGWLFGSERPANQSGHLRPGHRPQVLSQFRHLRSRDEPPLRPLGRAG